MTGLFFFFFFKSNPLGGALPTNWLFRFWGKPWPRAEQHLCFVRGGPQPGCGLELGLPGSALGVMPHGGEQPLSLGLADCVLHFCSGD